MSFIQFWAFCLLGLLILIWVSHLSDYTEYGSGNLIPSPLVFFIQFPPLEHVLKDTGGQDYLNETVTHNYTEWLDPDQTHWTT